MWALRPGLLRDVKQAGPPAGSTERCEAGVPRPNVGPTAGSTERCEGGVRIARFATNAQRCYQSQFFFLQRSCISAPIKRRTGSLFNAKRHFAQNNSSYKSPPSSLRLFLKARYDRQYVEMGSILPPSQLCASCYRHNYSSLLKIFDVEHHGAASQ